MLEQKVYCISLSSAKNCESWHRIPFSKWIQFNLQSLDILILSLSFSRVKKEKYVQFLPLLFWYRSLVMLDKMQFQNLFKNFFLLVLLTGQICNQLILKLDIKLHMNDSTS